MAEAGPPPNYDDSIAGSPNRFREYFATLSSDQLDIQQLFETVAEKLRQAPGIGETHPLCSEWNALRKRHRHIYRKSQHNAGMCARFLKSFATILVPLSQSKDGSLEHKKLMITRFLEAISVHLEAAKEHTVDFNEISKEVEVFPLKVGSALREASRPVGFLEHVLVWIQDICDAIWKALMRLINNLLDVFKAAFQGPVKLLRLGVCTPARYTFFFEMHFDDRPSKQITDADIDERTARERAGEIMDDCDTLASKLAAFEDAWHAVELACSSLSSDLEMAQTFSDTNNPLLPAFERQLQSAEMVYTPLVECLEAYAAMPEKAGRNRSRTSSEAT
ncbi:hypothetical protein OH76DRAFT_1478431 [Lentinus brumalis]|uniref:Uncharacterized protein n=1 Tax=Lentinus brumalis TaxID=2498619 RepID=A0A371DQV5_9APHY|nr:hypothetical protein OH76DRAFT_1478431 [Polyporus brumalis]